LGLLKRKGGLGVTWVQLTGVSILIGLKGVGGV
jgi:hypothetical protein